MGTQQVAQAQPLIPVWTLEDFYSETPYKWLYERRNNKFLLMTMLAQAQLRAKELKFIGFTKLWNTYVEQNSPKASILGSFQTAFPGQPMELQSGEYVCDEYGINYTGRVGEEISVCTHPIMPVERIINLDSGEEKLMLAYSRGSGNHWRSIIAGKDVLASAQKIITLAKNGIAVNSENAKEFVKYVSKIESLNYNELPVQNSTSHLGWLPDEQFAPYCESVVYDGDSSEFKRMFAGFHEQGDRDTWMQIALDTRSGKSAPARIALAASFAAPLIKVMNALPFFVHLWGTQGCGKTVGLMLAASVWGNPEVGQYIKTFGGTKVSQEIYASFCGNVPIILDELQIISDRKTFDDIIYMLCEGVSKGRGSKDGGLQLQRHWSSVIITSAEMPIVQSNSGGGAAVRTIEVNYGGEPLFQDSRYVAETLKQNYGFAGRQYIEALRDGDTMNELREVQRRFYSELSGEIQDKQVLSASILLAADWLAEKALFRDGKALTVDDIKPYLITREQADVNARCYDWLVGFIGGNPVRFEVDGNNGELWGVIERNENTVYFIRSFFDRILQANGYSAGSFLTWAARKGILQRGWRQDSLNTRKVINGTRVMTVALRLPDDDAEQYVQVPSDDLPF